jgi:Family of unknown function (DUF6232)
MTLVSEINILKENNVKITNLRAIIGTKTYAISDIASVSMDVNEPKLFLPVFFTVIAGVCLVLIALSDMREYSGCLNTSLYTGTAGLVFFIFSRKTMYSICIIGSTAVEIKVLESFDKEHVERIVKALNAAISQRE